MSDYICRRLLFCRLNKTNHQYPRYLPDQYQCRIVITRLIMHAVTNINLAILVSNILFRVLLDAFLIIFGLMKFFWRQLKQDAHEPKPPPANLVSRTHELVTFLRCLQHSFCCVLSQVLLNLAQAASQPLKSPPANHRLSWGWGWTNGRPHTWGLSRRRKKSRGRCVAWLTTQV